MVLAFLICFSKGNSVYAVEHPGSSQEEYPGGPETLSADEIIEGIKIHIESVEKNNFGFYPLRDEQEGADLRLKLLAIHDDNVSYIKKENAYFACVDFISYDGKSRYDIDFWMREEGEGELTAYQVKIHKKDDVPRYTYKEDEIAPVE